MNRRVKWPRVIDLSNKITVIPSRESRGFPATRARPVYGTVVESILLLNTTRATTTTTTASATETPTAAAGAATLLTWRGESHSCTSLTAL